MQFEKHEISRWILRDLWRHSTSSPRSVIASEQTERIIGETIREGWISIYVLETLLSESGFMGLVISHKLLKDALESFGIGIETRWSQPGGEEDTSVGCDGISSAGLASFFIYLDRCGITVDLSWIKRTFGSSLKNRSWLSRSELTILWHLRSKAVFPPLRLVASDKQGATTTSCEKKTARGGKAEARLDEEGWPVSVNIYQRGQKAIQAAA